MAVSVNEGSFCWLVYCYEVGSGLVHEVGK